ncbi:low molecular weight phosphatase family protein [Streptomyces sp. TRM66268-LWL]|uniref:Low molecular weight phosphatase family protein n=1 Tax=Streptomyces polyasparticus TaxID=2767826 RepID=A0ABR7SIZ0_9ACTN|nr:low molecular weight phosphatase family protein [Streptomyces polyasparticus]MBC9714431.1 low molecular weight phosphatase family protein [Streptomyces polyasparticus]
MVSVLFVCTGNVHRSVLAERLLARHAPGLRVSSAGTEAVRGAGMDAATRSVLARFGATGPGFVSRQLTEELVAGSDLVLGLAREHREAAVRLCPSALRRCFTLREFVRLTGAVQPEPGAGAVAAAAAARGRLPVPAAGADDIADPWEQGYDVLRECAEDINAAVVEVAHRLSRPELPVRTG